MNSIKQFKEKMEKNPFIIMDEYSRVFCGLRGGYPSFSIKYEDARELYNINQFKKVQYGTTSKLEMFYV